MSNPNSCPPDYSQFSIDELEQTYVHLRGVMVEAGNAVLAQSAVNTASGRLSPAALHLERRLIDTSSDDLASMVQFLESATFATPGQNERARLLLIRHHLDFGEATLTSIAEMIPKMATRHQHAA